MKNNHSNGVCGTNTNGENLDFASQGNHLVYLDKVFSIGEADGCPLIQGLDTGLLPPTAFTVEYEARDLRNCAVPCPLDPNAIFTIEESCVLLELVRLVPPGTIRPAQVTLNGFPVDTVTLSNGQYTATTANVISLVQNDRCIQAGRPTETLFMVHQVGPWEIRMRIILVGTVNVGGRTCAFRVEINSSPNCTTVFPLPMTSSFTIPDLSLPCVTNGIAPDIVFRFTGDLELAMPRLYVTNCQPHTSDNHLAFSANLVFQPEIHAEVVRRTLFSLEARAASDECDLSERECDTMCNRRRRNDDDDEVGGISRRCCEQACRICRECCRRDDDDDDEVGGISDRRRRCRRRDDDDDDEVGGVMRACDRVAGATTGLISGCGCGNLGNVAGVSDRNRCWCSC